MSVATVKWEARKCRSEDGILFASDHFVTLTGCVKGGYQSGSVEPLAALLSRGVGDWVTVDPLCRSEDNASGVIVEAGEGAWEGEGFVAVTNSLSGELVWVLHLSGSEAFRAVTVYESEVVAVAKEYPIRNEFHIPLKEPHRLRVISGHEY